MSWAVPGDKKLLTEGLPKSRLGGPCALPTASWWRPELVLKNDGLVFLIQRVPFLLCFLWQTTPLISSEPRASKPIDIDFKHVVGAGINVKSSVKKFVFKLAWLKFAVL
jgi:hypothetical protein